MAVVKSKKILLIGACGMGVAPLGIYLAKSGYQVSGIDDYPDPIIVKRLESSGVRFLEYFDPRQDYDEIIVTRAIDSDPDRFKMIKETYPLSKVYYRGEYLARIANERKAVVIAGSHGKTSTTGNIIQLLSSRGFGFSYILGGFFSDNAIDAADCNPASDWLVLEVDESDRTIELFSPEVTVVTNVDFDHVGAYSSAEDVKNTFLSLAERTRNVVVVPKGEFVKNTLESNKKWIEIDSNGFSNFEALNMAVSEKVCSEICSSKIDSNIESIKVERRQISKVISDDCISIQDYAHHPVEIESLYQWCELRYPEYQIDVVFQPHRYSRTKALMEDFVSVLSKYRCILVPEYGAFEAQDKSGASIALYNRLKEKTHEVDYCQNPFELITSLLSRNDQQKRLILFVGAGDIRVWADWIEWVWNQQSQSFEDQYQQFLSHRFVDGSKFSIYEPLKRKVTLNVGGSARYYAEPNSRSALQFLLTFCRIFELNCSILGKGSNLLMADDLYDGLLIRLNQKYWKQIDYLANGRYFVRAGAGLKEICRDALSRGVDGFNFFDGIPGSIGGAVRMNAGAMGRETSDRIVEIECLDRSGKLKVFSRKDLTFTYRNCKNLDGLIVTGVVLEGQPDADVVRLNDELSSLRKRRLATQPAEPSAGCMFKNPEGDSAGRLIDVAGLKGRRVGGAIVSEKHANFLITEKGANATDVLELLALVQGEVKSLYGIDLEQEIKVFPNDN